MPTAYIQPMFLLIGYRQAHDIRFRIVCLFRRFLFPIVVTEIGNDQRFGGTMQRNRS